MTVAALVHQLPAARPRLIVSWSTPTPHSASSGLPGTRRLLTTIGTRQVRVIAPFLSIPIRCPACDSVALLAADSLRNAASPTLKAVTSTLSRRLVAVIAACPNLNPASFVASASGASLLASWRT